ncbi:class I SAM-dependent methyltransferase [Candidatus Thorarchaeota archaeon]|nr:MAG: class I SAM-dependent methyltransferase [Candidatus Thorarchaeota archaeon]
MVETKQVRDHYDTISGGYESHDPTIGKRLRKILSHTDFSKRKVMDVAGGTGYIGQTVMQMGGTYIDLDISTGMLSLAKDKFSGIQGDYLLILSDVHKIPVQSNMVDIALVSEVLEHVENPNRVLREVCRVLKPEGIIIVTNPNPFWAPIQFVAEKVRFKAPEGPHKYIYHKELIRTIEREGFSILTVDIDFLPSDRSLWRWLESKLKNTILENFALKHYIIASKD